MKRLFYSHVILKSRGLEGPDLKSIIHISGCSDLDAASNFQLTLGSVVWKIWYAIILREFLLEVLPCWGVQGGYQAPDWQRYYSCGAAQHRVVRGSIMHSSCRSKSELNNDGLSRRDYLSRKATDPRHGAKLHANGCLPKVIVE